MKEGTRWSWGAINRKGTDSLPHPLPLAPAGRGREACTVSWAWNALAHHLYLGNPQKDFSPHSPLPLHLRALGCCVPLAFIKHCLAEQIRRFLRLLPLPFLAPLFTPISSQHISHQSAQVKKNTHQSLLTVWSPRLSTRPLTAVILIQIIFFKKRKSSLAPILQMKTMEAPCHQTSFPSFHS